MRTGRATWPRQALPGGRARSRGQTAAEGRGARRARERLHQATDRSGEITPPQPPFPPLSVASGSAASFITSRCRLLPACPAAGRRSQPGHRTDGARPPRREAPPLPPAASGRGEPDGPGACTPREPKAGEGRPRPPGCLPRRVAMDCRRGLREAIGGGGALRGRGPGRLGRGRGGRARDGRRDVLH